MTASSLARIRAVSRRLRLRSGGALTGLPGSRASGLPGPGMSFAGYRDYQHGDDVRLIDWNVFARQSRPSVKVFHRDRASQFLFIADASASMYAPDASKWDMAAGALSLLAVLAADAGDRVGSAVVTDRVECATVPRSGDRHVCLMVEALASVSPRSPLSDMRVALTHAGRVLRRPGALIIASDCLDRDATVPRWIAGLGGLRRHTITVLLVSSPIERDLPDVGLLEVADAETGERLWIDTHAAKVRRTFARQAAHRRREVLQEIRRTGASAVELWTDQPLVRQLRTMVRRRTGP